MILIPSRPALVGNPFGPGLRPQVEPPFQVVPIRSSGARYQVLPQGEALKDTHFHLLVHLNAFCIDKYEVTNEAYGRFFADTGKGGPPYANDPRFNGERHPVVGVSFNEAQAFCQWAGKRLPTEAEWEKAGRGEEGRHLPSSGPSGDSFWGVRDRANLKVFIAIYPDYWGTSYAADGFRYTSPVGSFPKGQSLYGVHDLIGNVWEWVSEPLPAAHGSLDSRRRELGLRVQKGGSWMSMTHGLSLLTKRWRPPDMRGDFTVGFRCASDVGE